MNKLERHSYSHKEREDILVKTGCKCGHCGVPLTTADMTVEHIFPISKGGQDDEFNKIALCRSCNYNKGNWVYRVEEYYKYILPEYVDSYMVYSEKAVANYKKNHLVNFDAITYRIVPDKYKIMIANMKRRGVKRDKLLKTIDKLSMNIVLDKAYDGDADEIFELISKPGKIAKNVFNTSLYKNVYTVRHDIKYGEAYVLRLNGNLCGAVIFKRIKPEDIDLVQLDIISSNTRLKKKYIMSMVYLSDMVNEIMPDMMEDMYQNMLNTDSIPLYFNILGNLYSCKDDIITMPYSLDGTNGTIEFMHLKAIREKYKDMLKSLLESKNDLVYSDDELDELTDYLLADSEKLAQEQREDVKKHISDLLSRSKVLCKAVDTSKEDAYKKEK